VTGRLDRVVFLVLLLSSGSSPGGRSRPGWRSANRASPTRSPRPSSPTARPAAPRSYSEAGRLPDRSPPAHRQGRRDGRDSRPRAAGEGQAGGQADQQRALQQIDAAPTTPEAVGRASHLGRSTAGKSPGRAETEDHSRLIQQAVPLRPETTQAVGAVSDADRM